MLQCSVINGQGCYAPIREDRRLANNHGNGKATASDHPHHLTALYMLWLSCVGLKLFIDRILIVTNKPATRGSGYMGINHTNLT